MSPSATLPNCCLVFLVSCALLHPSLAADPVNFGRDILPVLSDNCFQCHGPDEANREAGLRLDRKEGIFAELESGEQAVVRGKSSASSLYERISTTDPDLRMPPADSGKSLSDTEVIRIS